jgi:hypothetical protein
VSRQANVAFCAGKSATSAVYAAPAAAAGAEAPRGASGGSTSGWNCVYRRVMPLTASKTDVWTIAPMRLLGWGDVCATSSASTSVLFQSVTTSADAVPGTARATAAASAVRTFLGVISRSPF